MRQGPWHQFGFQSQTLAAKLLNDGIGAGVVFSCRDQTYEQAKGYAPEFHDRNIDILIDHQFYCPNFKAEKFSDWPTNDHRKSLSTLAAAKPADLAKFSRALEKSATDLHATGILAPAVLLDALDVKTAALNKKLFKAASAVGKYMGLPTYATVVVAHGTATSPKFVDTLSAATSHVVPDGWFYSIENDDQGLPGSEEHIWSLCRGGLALAATGKPVLHAFAGPLALLSAAFGARASGLAHFQNMWGFSRGRFEESEGGGGGSPQPKYFSGKLWCGLSYPAELAQVETSTKSAAKVLTPTTYSDAIRPPFADEWDHKSSRLHFLAVLSEHVSRASKLNAKDAAQEAIKFMKKATKLDKALRGDGALFDERPGAYLTAWSNSVTKLLKEREKDFEWLSSS